MLAREFGWTREQIDNEDNVFIEDMMSFIYYAKKREQYEAKMANK